MKKAPHPKRQLPGNRLPEWERLLSTQAAFQSHFPASVLTGGTATALHAGHRVSLDKDPDVSISQQLAMKLAEPKPWDLADTNLSRYKNLQPPYDDWREILRRCHAVGQKIALSWLPE